jgi:mannose-6-phosphate isomerase-like protein (cupin superfamily)
MQPKYSIDLHHMLSAGELKIIEWAKSVPYDPEAEAQTLIVPTGARPVRLAHSHATGEALASNGLLGADIIRLSAGDGFVPHVHPGDHLLIVIGGQGTVSYGGKIYPTQAGEIYMIDGNVPHAVGAITDHVILAVGSPHRPIDSPDRMTPVEYDAVTAHVSDMHCLICDIKASLPDRPHDHGCPHCPCEACHPL